MGQQTETIERSRGARALRAALAAAVLAAAVAGCAETEEETRPPIAAEEQKEPWVEHTDPTIDDDAIRAALLEFFCVDPPLFDGKASVEVQKGVVTIEGTSPSLLAKERALDIVRKIRGVRSIVDLVEVEPATRTDDELEHDVRKALDVSHMLGSEDVSVRVEDGEVTLEGTVDSVTERHIALDSARGVIGVGEVVDELEVEPSEVRTDEDILAEVEQALRRDPYIDARGIEVLVEGAMVYLEGKVGTLVERSLAAAEARVPGVRRVFVTDLAVDPELSDPMKRSTAAVSYEPEDIAEAVERAFEVDPRVTSTGLRVRMRGSQAVVDGVVTSLHEKQAVLEDASNTMGIREVVDLLEVEPLETVEDEELERRAEKALERDPFLHDRELTIRVTGGEVTVAGAVRSAFERRHAVDVVSALDGVTQVVDDMERDPANEPASGEEIEKRLESALFWSPFVDHGRLEVEVDDRGVATLGGWVEDYTQLELVNTLALEAGATGIRTSICVEGSEELVQHCRPLER